MTTPAQNPGGSPFFAGAQTNPGTPQLAPNPLNGQNTFANLMAPFFQQNQQMDPSMQLLLPQLLFNSAMAQSLQQSMQNQQTPQGTATPQSQTNPFDMISKLFTGLNQNKPEENK